MKSPGQLAGPQQSGEEGGFTESTFLGHSCGLCGRPGESSVLVEQHPSCQLHTPHLDSGDQGTRPADGVNLLQVAQQPPSLCSQTGGHRLASDITMLLCWEAEDLGISAALLLFHFWSEVMDQVSLENLFFFLISPRKLQHPAFR